MFITALSEAMQKKKTIGNTVEQTTPGKCSKGEYSDYYSYTAWTTSDTHLTQNVV
jgi:hypothetical protein